MEPIVAEASKVEEAHDAASANVEKDEAPETAPVEETSFKEEA